MPPFPRIALRWILVVGLMLTAAGRVYAQAADTVSHATTAPLAWRLVADGQQEAWTTLGPLDSLRVVARSALQTLQRDGYYLARIDSVRLDTTRTPAEAALFATRGPIVEVGRLQLGGAVALDSLDLLRLMDTRPGRRLDPARLEADLEALLRRYERQGFPLAQATIESIRLMPGEPPRLDVRIRLDEGRSLRLRRIEVAGATRTRADYVARVAELRIGQPLVGYDPEAIRQRLEATAFFRSVGAPQLFIEGDSVAVVRIPIEEESPGAFDLVLGYLPPVGGTGGGSLVGNGHLDLRNLFGVGRRLSLRLNRLPGRVSSFEVRAADPFVFGLPLGVAGEFDGKQQDSTFNKQRYALEIGYRFVSHLEVFATASREQTRPGIAGERLSQGRQRVARADAWFLGLGVRYQRLDRRVNPRRGLLVETFAERGTKERTERRVRPAEQDTVREASGLRQERLRAHARAYLPTFVRQVLVVGGEARVLLTDEADASDLFRFGGATSLRGYDEERFLATFAARLFLEYRYQLDRTSFGFVFFDLGYVERDKVVDLDPLSGFYPGYGVGFQVGTDLGLINLSLAANPDEPTSLRAHLGLSIGL